MWPQQPGGEQNPPPPNPYQQPSPYGPQGHEQPGPYQQAGPQGQHGQHGQAAHWGPSMPPGAPEPSKPGTRPSVAIAIVGAVAVIAAAAVAGVVLLNEDDDGEGPGPGADGSATPSAAAPPKVRDDPDNPRAPGAPTEVEAVIPGWKAVSNPKRHNVFDVPSDWEVKSPSLYVGYENDKGDQVTMTGVAAYKDGWCENSSRALSGTKGASGAKTTAEAAENEANAWATLAFDDKQQGTFEQTEAEPFSNEHGVSGHVSTATATGVPKNDKCASDGKAVAFTFEDTDGEFATWVLVTDTGNEDEVPDATIDKIMGSLRPLE